MFLFFFFQAEDGIRDKLVTGVQTCALPIYTQWSQPRSQQFSGSGSSGGSGITAWRASLRARMVEITARASLKLLGRSGIDWKSVGEGKRVDIGGCRII